MLLQPPAPARVGITFVLRTMSLHVSQKAETIHRQTQWTERIVLPSQDDVERILGLKPSETYAKFLVHGDLDSERNFLHAMAENLDPSQRIPLERALQIPQRGNPRYIRAILLKPDEGMTRITIFE